ncbi:MAG TPA: type II toxin-antitoxin system HipA family toxin [Leucothrix mucor]|nr:type II toxin-antitoxin system HipA family toxin [Leucothrix mucor]
MRNILNVYLSNRIIGNITLLSGERSFFAFDESYLNDDDRLTLSQSFFSQQGGIIAETKIRQTKLPPFFSNLLPEGHLRTYLASQGGINASREFKLIELLGEDLPGAVSIKPLEGAEISDTDKEAGQESLGEAKYRFSLAGVQLKFSALADNRGGLTIPVSGIGGDWIVKLPAQNFMSVPENEWSMLDLAEKIGIPVPETKLIDLDEIKGLPDLGVLSGTKALAVKRFDRSKSGKRIHIEDFAQVFGVYPHDKYHKANYANLANMVWMLTGETGLTDFIRRLTFSILIGNGDMHLKNWSLIYPDGRVPQLAPAYDFVSTVPYIPDDKLALNLSGTKDMGTINLNHFKKLAAKAHVPEFLLLKVVKETVEETKESWSQNKLEYPLSDAILKRIDQHLLKNNLLLT